MRITGGDLRSRIISVPNLDIPGFRPTTDFMREVIFSSVQNFFSLEGSRVLDLFAGTASVAFECLSRGAGHAVAVELDTSLCRHAQEMVQKFSLEDKFQIINCNVNEILNEPQQSRLIKGAFDLIFTDAPYDTIDFLGFTRSILDKQLFATNSVFIFEDRAKNIQNITDKKEYETLPQLNLKKSKIFGDAGVLIFEVYDETLV